MNNCIVYDTGLMFLVHEGSSKAIRKAYNEQLQESGKGHEKTEADTGTLSVVTNKELTRCLWVITRRETVWCLMTPVCGSFGTLPHFLWHWVGITFPRETGQGMSRALKIIKWNYLKEIIRLVQRYMLKKCSWQHHLKWKKIGKNRNNCGNPYKRILWGH